MKKTPSCFYSSVYFFSASSLIYFLLSLLYKGNDVIRAASFHMPMYHSEHPYYFIGLLSILFFICMRIFSSLKIRPGFLKYVFFYSCWIILFCFFGGLLWSYFDMKAGYFPEGGALISKLLKDGLQGLYVGIFMVFISSLPYNAILFGLSLLLLRKKIFRDKG